jgi:hypothetical protein
MANFVYIAIRIHLRANELNVGIFCRDGIVIAKPASISQSASLALPARGATTTPVKQGFAGLLL